MSDVFLHVVRVVIHINKFEVRFVFTFRPHEKKNVLDKVTQPVHAYISV